MSHDRAFAEIVESEVALPTHQFTDKRFFFFQFRD